MTFVCVWWLVIFLILPFGNNWDEHNEIQEGLSKSAPTKNTLRTKAKITTVIAAVLTIAANVVVNW